VRLFNMVMTLKSFSRIINLSLLILIPNDLFDPRNRCLFNLDRLDYSWLGFLLFLLIQLVSAKVVPYFFELLILLFFSIPLDSLLLLLGLLDY
jgi:hypothetical protein